MPAGPDITAIGCDVMSERAWAPALRQCLDRLGRADVPADNAQARRA